MSDPSPPLPTPDDSTVAADDQTSPDPTTSWAVVQTFTPATSTAVRDDMVELIQRDLLGPWAAENSAYEELPYRSPGPLERYLVGRLGPRRDATTINLAAAEDPQITDEDLGGDNDPSDAELPNLLTVQNAGRMWPSSIGLSFTVDGSTDVIAVTATWGRYSRTSSIDPETDKPRSVWARQPFPRPDQPPFQEVRLDTPPAEPIVLDGDANEGVQLRVEVRPVAAPDGSARRVVELALVNNLPELATNKDANWLFQPQLTVTALDGASPVFLPIADPLDEVAAPDKEFEERHLDLLYRNTLKYSDGRNVAVQATSDPGSRRASKLVTTWLPVHEVPATKAPSVDETPQLAGLVLSMDELAVMPGGELAAALSPLATGYQAWLAERETEASSGLPEPWRPTAAQAVFRAQRVAERIAAGIGLLAEDSARGADALKAFQFANEAMASQRRHTAVSARRSADPELTYADALALVEAEGAKGASWRPFQLAFILLNLPALADPLHAERTPGAAGLVDLLFFPTGGGKTEAYLGLAAFTFAIRRLQGTIGSDEDARDGRDGVGVLMRYTLRLLTAQQFQRAAALVCAAEVIRRRDEATWGEVPFRIGLWVGSGVAPNWFDEAESEIALAKETGKDSRVKVLQLLYCPWCGHKLKGHDDLEPSPTNRRILLYCGNSEGKVDAADEASRPCPFSKRRAKGEGLPILTVDEEIYRLLPALVVATVDKFAQLPWQGYAGMLFGRVHQRCPRHGYRHDDLDKKTECGHHHHAAGSEFPAVTSEPVTRLRPPDLIIQDELHLISGALGTTVGLFEAAVDLLCQWPVVKPDGTVAQVGPKIIASTATTKRSADQVKRLFARRLSVFPPQVLDVADTFFSRQVPVTPENPGRRYLGLCAHGVRLKSAEIRLSEILLVAGQTLFDQYGEAADPYMTLVGYFNATRELAGMRRLLDDDVTTRVRRNGRRRGLSNRLIGTRSLEVAELTSRISSADITAALKQLEVGFSAETDTSARRRAVGAAFASAMKGQGAMPEVPRRTEYPVDVVLATSMLQVGVDVSRFGLMVVTGQPKNTAEYIQASSRVGRDADRPGLVVTLYNWSRPRDLAHYEDFEHYHATFYRQVEALSVTPYARRSLDRSTAATFTAAVRNVIDGYSRKVNAQNVELDNAIVNDVRRRLLQRALDASDGRGRDYFRERIEVFRDRWKLMQAAQAAHLGYSEGKFQGQPMLALLVRPAGAWTDRTVGMSMRETENDINLLVSGSEDDLFGLSYGAPDWSAPTTSADEDDKAGEAQDNGTDVPDGDEFGEGR